MSNVLKSWLAICVVLSIFVFSAIVSLVWVENIPLCFFHYLTGWDCPGCGLTRAFVAFFHGDFYRAIQLNAMAPVIILWLAIYLADHIYAIVQGYRPKWFTETGNKIIGKLFCVLFFGQWIYKSVFVFYTQYLH